jgi:hypothetical protein
VVVDQTLLWAEGVELDQTLLWAQGVEVAQTLLWAQGVELDQTLQQTEMAGDMVLDQTQQKTEEFEIWMGVMAGQNFQTEVEGTGPETDCRAMITSFLKLVTIMRGELCYLFPEDGG